MRQATIAKKEGMISLDIVSILSPDIADATNRLIPYGGDIKPQARFTVIMSPKWMGSIPIIFTTGRSMGVRMMTAAILSTKHPITRRKTLMISKRTIGLSTNVVSQLAIFANI